MFVITFDLITSEVTKRHPKGVTRAYSDIGKTLEKFGFHGVQGSVYITENNEISNMYRAIEALKQLPWLAGSIGELRVLRAELGSDFTAIIKGTL
jgi:virulence-associated protein VapD